MPFYVKQGQIPNKRHIAFEKDNGELYREELFSTHGFSNIYSNKYHHNMPTKAIDVAPYSVNHGEAWQDALIQNYKLDSKKADTQGNFFSARNKIFFNNDVAMYTAKVTEATDEFYRNAYCDEVIFVHEGEGTLYSEYGELAVKKWDYLVIPRGTIYQLKFNDFNNVRLFVIESASMVEIPKHFRNDYGQLTESAPYCERDFRVPELAEAVVEKGEFPLVCKFGDKYQLTTLEWHPFDLVGWDGFVYPWAFNITEYAPKVGKIHLPPSDHIVFTAHNFVVCNFVPRLYDFHEKSIPAPYYHNNIDSDEVLYYVDGDFMSRTGIEPGSMTLHQKGVPHGPQPGKTEASIGKKETYEYAVMVDTFAPLQLTTHVQQCMSQDYNRSWLED
ncbi:homogentisate 1,2-dioxygenase [Shewanella maritima]|uniref:Homogentisate 1,2-dioxygenase n=1 Tax=Shewanella maritima TaxID=2520507 RepID=A0A411PLS5_9GAMM|nr:homogentisate 1,2-dioxygenase [Shewanella maritima]QBF84459.1 homogentisate 1,2-dioxygenase [Shewanella maritima]